jgi:hypothetical protein
MEFWVFATLSCVFLSYSLELVVLCWTERICLVLYSPLQCSIRYTLIGNFHWILKGLYFIVLDLCLLN